MVITYHIDLTEDPDVGGYTAEIRELPGCISEGETIAEALVHIGEVMAEWVVIAEVRGFACPPGMTRNLEIESAGRVEVALKDFWADPKADP
jgi:predicted RNase H-like HicB family nuclease